MSLPRRHAACWRCVAACAGCPTGARWSAGDPPSDGQAGRCREAVEPSRPSDRSRDARRLRRSARRRTGRQAEPEAPVDAAAQRAFDAARRALRAGRNDEAERGFSALAQAESRPRRRPRQPRPDLPPGRQARRIGGRARAGGEGQPDAAGVPQPARHHLPPGGPVREGARRLRASDRARPDYALAASQSRHPSRPVSGDGRAPSSSTTAICAVADGDAGSTNGSPI